ncbi:LacI family DNA-binding transcriptional regulator [Microbacterium jejuense]|uniref:LacI family DNA-binding transcriptional regulator n=1 Tax=Microbacterium jejuense TaxID=1263637 RepID=A0ABS7HLH0_9MICO|nr:LacI family DNA-binding transcriptional regulator [Microbacterium jejuense]MBW9093072.1 LacI family DNA-binding transcriptional regulator [Microbacterium jejuense]
MARTRTPTIVDIAAYAGVSKSAVSRALSGQGEVHPETRRKIVEAADRLGYVANVMARNLVSSRTKTLGVVLRDVRKPYYAFLQAAMQSQAEERGYRIVATTNAGQLEVEEALHEIKNLISLQVDGIIVAPARLPTSKFKKFLDRVPLVVAGRQEITPGISSVACDDSDGGRALVRHLLDLGHRQIAVVLVDPQYSQRYYTRGAAMIDEIRANGADPIVLTAGTDLATAEVVSQHLRNLDATAIMCPTDPAAMDLLEVLRVEGSSALTRYSVTGYDGYGPLASPFLGLTTFRIPQEEIGRTAVDLLVDRLEGRSENDRFVSLRGSVVPGRTARPIMPA